MFYATRETRSELMSKIVQMITSAGVRNIAVKVDLKPNGSVSIILTGRTHTYHFKQRAQEVVLSLPDLEGVNFKLENDIKVV